METYINLWEENHHVATSGGEFWDNDYSFKDYGLSIGDLTVSGITPENFSKLATTMINHLIVNGHNFKLEKNHEYIELIEVKDN